MSWLHESQTSDIRRIGTKVPVYKRWTLRQYFVIRISGGPGGIFFLNKNHVTNRRKKQSLYITSVQQF